MKYLDWMKKYAPPQAQGMTFSESGPVPSQGNIAQQIFWYTAFTADMVKPGLPVMNADGTPKWRMAPSPHGSYWKDGMKLGYQDVGSATLLKSTPVDRRKAAWLYLQFIVSKTVSLKKSHVGLTFIRESDIWDKSFTERAPKLGGLIEFYRSPARVQWTPTGNNVPDYPKLAQLWWQNIGDASSGAKTPQAAMDSLAAAQDSVMERLEKSGVQGACGPKLNTKETAEYWFAKSAKDGNIAPQRKLANEKPKGETIDYDTLIKSWPATPPKRACELRSKRDEHAKAGSDPGLSSCRHCEDGRRSDPASFARRCRSFAKQSGSDPGLLARLYCRHRPRGGHPVRRGFRHYRWRRRLLDARVRGHDQLQEPRHAHDLSLRSGIVGASAAAGAGAQRACRTGCGRCRRKRIRTSTAARSAPSSNARPLSTPWPMAC